MREIVLDCETTGLDADPNNKESGGHRIVELAAVELNGVRMGRRWHSLFDPGREVEPEAAAVHGWTWEKLKGQPKFADLAEDLLAFIDGATLIAHNAPFDASFLRAEFWRCGKPCAGDWIDTLPLARKQIPRKRHTLDALCQHFGVRKSARTMHSATLDTVLLAECYVRLVGRLDQLRLEGMEGGERIWMRGGEMIILAHSDLPHPGPRPNPLPGRLTLEELRAHKEFMKQLKEDQKRASENSD